MYFLMGWNKKNDLHVPEGHSCSRRLRHRWLRLVLSFSLLKLGLWQQLQCSLRHSWSDPHQICKKGLINFFVGSLIYFCIFVWWKMPVKKSLRNISAVIHCSFSERSKKQTNVYMIQHGIFMNLMELTNDRSMIYDLWVGAYVNFNKYSHFGTLTQGLSKYYK